MEPVNAAWLSSQQAERDVLVRGPVTLLPTAHGDFSMMLYAALDADERPPHVVLLRGDIESVPLVRIHSECLTGDVFGSLRCDCGQQLDAAMAAIAARGSGLLLYMRQEGRGIGLASKVRAYALQDGGLDTVEANRALGFSDDHRDHGESARILADLGIREVELLTNNPNKIDGLEDNGIRVVKRIPLLIDANQQNRRYLHTKQQKMGHLF
jgi:3,4-dihydroxy 2-butanone 4-phosphate synthase/GTP cyclohydrolase II